MIAFMIASVLSALYAGCYALHAAPRRHFAAMLGAALLAILALAAAFACLLLLIPRIR